MNKGIEKYNLFLFVQAKRSEGISIIAANADWKFGLPKVPITPFVFESHLRKSIPKLLNYYKILLVIYYANKFLISKKYL